MKSDFCDSLWPVSRLNLSDQLPGYVGCNRIFVVAAFVVIELIIVVSRLNLLYQLSGYVRCSQVFVVAELILVALVSGLTRRRPV